MEICCAADPWLSCWTAKTKKEEIIWKNVWLQQFLTMYLAAHNYYWRMRTWRSLCPFAWSSGGSLIITVKDFDFNYVGFKIEINWEKFTSVGDDFKNSISLSAFPNPFSNSTSIKYTLDSPAPVRINIYNSLGHRITTLVDELMTEGEHRAVFNAKNLNSGMYYYTIHTGQQTAGGKLLLAR